MAAHYTIEWLIEDTVIFLRLSGDLSLADARAIDAELARLTRAGKPPVHTVADLSELGKFPFDLISTVQINTHAKEPNIGWIVAYGSPSRFANTFAQLLAKVARVKFRFAHDKDEALRVLCAEDARLKALIETSKDS